MSEPEAGAGARAHSPAHAAPPAPPPPPPSAAGVRAFQALPTDADLPAVELETSPGEPPEGTRAVREFQALPTDADLPVAAFGTSPGAAPPTPAPFVETRTRDQAPRFSPTELTFGAHEPAAGDQALDATATDDAVNDTRRGRLVPRSLFGRYEIQKLLGRGGMGAVYLARQTDLDRLCVVKVISAESLSDRMLGRFDREARAAAAINSENAVKIYEVGHVQDVPFIAFEFVEGRSLDNLLRERGALPFEEATRIALDAAHGLAAAHEAGVLHRDVKPANILLTTDGKAKVADFGLARWTGGNDDGLTQAGAVLGSPSYMAPEQAEAKEVDARVDVYALGITWYELLTGTLPFPGKTYQEVVAKKLRGHCDSPRDLVASVPLPVAEVCVRLMALRPEDRPATMLEAIHRIEGALVEAGRPVPRRTTKLPLAREKLAGLETAIVPPASPSSSLSMSAPTSSPGNDVTVPGRFGRYELERLLGRGGMGAVYLARETGLERPVVLKVIRKELAKEPEIVERLRREARAAARIKSESVVTVYDSGSENGMPFIAMEFVAGQSAAALLASKKGPLETAEATRIVLGAAKGLRAAHELGILHRDVKPANLLLAENGRVKVADFGTAKDPSQGAMTAQGELLGTPSYMSPEQLEAQPLDARSDVFALGASYYELLTGHLPFPGGSWVQVLVARTRPLVPPRKRNPAVPEAVERLVLQMLESDRDRRPKDMAAVIALLEAVSSAKATAPANAQAQGPAASPTPATRAAQKPAAALPAAPGPMEWTPVEAPSGVSTRTLVAIVGIALVFVAIAFGLGLWLGQR